MELREYLSKTTFISYQNWGGSFTQEVKNFMKNYDDKKERKEQKNKGEKIIFCCFKQHLGDYY